MLGGSLGGGGALRVPHLAEGAHGGQAGEAIDKALHAPAFVIHGDDEFGLAQGFDLAAQLGKLAGVLVIAAEQDDAADGGV